MNERPPFLHELGTALAQDRLTAERATAAALARIAAWNGTLGAFVAVDPDRALTEARHLDQLAALGVPKGPLFGLPIGIKDIIDVAGFPTEAGSLTRKGSAPAPADATVVSRLRQAGAVIVGKTATVEYAFGGWGTNETLGTPRNPWDLATPRVPGGSSSGSGVAVAAGLVPAALGSDTGGSIRLPASFSGLVGLKTTAGLIDKGGVLPLCDPLDTIGVMTRCVADAALMFEAIGGPPARDLRRSNALANRRVGVFADLGVPLDPDTRRVYDETLGLIEKGGARLVDVRMPQSLAAYTDACGMFLAVEGYCRYGAFAEEIPNRLGDAVRQRLLSGKAATAPQFLANMWRRESQKLEIAAAFEAMDAIVMPSTAMPAPTVADHNEGESPAVFTRFANYFDLAAISVPMGLTRDGLPVGMQLVVPGGRETRALVLGAALEAARGGPLLCPILDQ
jgi:aspartyl-tRNA(Asn)/glutamyl-tRNA(Gln) amidotransferase subunit A